MEENLNENSHQESQEIKRTVTMKGRPMILQGEEIKIGSPAPDFKVIANDMLPMKFKRTYSGKTVLLSSVPSLDTPVCDLETRKFNSEAEKLSPEMEIVTISMDLPFAQSRWCGAAGVKRVKTYSDYMKAEFGKAYGVLIKDLRLLARAIFIVDKNSVIRYVQIVPEVTQEPNYEEALKALKEIAQEN